MSEFIYRYWKELPKYSPDKFSIVGGFDSDDKLSQHTTRIGNYYGRGEYAIDESELDNLYFEPNKIITIGANDINDRKTASTVEPELLKLFSNIDRNLDPVPGKSVKLTKTGGNVKHDETPAMRYSDITDEILYSCPDIEVNEDNEVNDKNDYLMAQEIDNINGGDFDDYDIEIDNEKNSEKNEDIEVADDIENIEDTDDADDTNIMQFLK
ncbi:Hypothetical protein PACV_316 [Pacmanvirus A23]|uniref:Hypothetical protein n=1 Tax=Pacmanvirus A23 TaxID=1932881 RepID=UPI000A092287|nr:Hypothetical protein B9W72_gp312 [Pacmanvirus A23]SIP86029.1 Hypothetical protein PACV_316 [Pacmanvirus A23]